MFNKSFILLSAALISLVAVASVIVDSRLIDNEDGQSITPAPVVKPAEPVIDPSLARARQLANEATKAADRALSPETANKLEKPVILAQANTAKQPAAETEPSIANDVRNVFVEGWKRMHRSATSATQPPQTKTAQEATQQTATKPVTPPAVTPPPPKATPATTTSNDPLAPAAPPIDLSELSSAGLIAVTKEVASATRTSFRESWRRMHQEPITAVASPDDLKDMEKRLKPESKPVAVTPPPAKTEPPKAPEKKPATTVAETPTSPPSPKAEEKKPEPPTAVVTAPTTPPPAPKTEEKKPEPPKAPAKVTAAPTTPPPALKTEEKKPEPPKPPATTVTQAPPALAPKVEEKKSALAKTPATVGPKANPDPKLKTGQETVELKQTSPPTKEPVTGTPETKEEVLPKKTPEQRLAELPPVTEKKQPIQKPLTGTPETKEKILPSKKPAPVSTPKLAQRAVPLKPEISQSRPAARQDEMKRRHFRSLDTYAPRSSLGVKPSKRVTTGRWYVVKEGDTLTGIAASELGDPRKYRAIWKANRNRIGDPDVIWQGLRLRLP